MAPMVRSVAEWGRVAWVLVALAGCQAETTADCAEDLDCPSGAPVCLSGFCSSICPVDVDVCPDPQTCFVYEDPNSSTPPTSGICTVVCDDEYPCGGDDVCVQGVCLASCMLDTDCGSSETCLGNICIPNS